MAAAQSSGGNICSGSELSTPALLCHSFMRLTRALFRLDPVDEIMHTHRQTELLAIHHGGYHSLQLDSRPLVFFPLLLMSSSSVFFWILGSTGHAHVGHAYGVNHPSHSSSVNHAAASTEGVNIMNAAMLVTSGGPQKQASNSHTVPTITAQLLTLPCIRAVMPLALSHDNDR